MMENTSDVAARIREGMDVYSSDDEKLGQVGEVNIGTTTEVSSQTTSEERSFFQVKSGMFGLGSDLWLPANLVGSVDDDRVLLAVTKDEAQQQGWGERPTTPEPDMQQGGGLFS